MEDNQIDVVQFESTTKVGKQGVIDLNDVSTEDEVTQRLKDTTGIGFGNENPNVVHKVSYEDYGIQTATPEHAIDAVQLVGTQIRKLITADISDDTTITVDGRSMTKKSGLTCIMLSILRISYKHLLMWMRYSKTQRKWRKSYLKRLEVIRDMAWI